MKVISAQSAGYTMTGGERCSAIPKDSSPRWARTVIGSAATMTMIQGGQNEPCRETNGSQPDSKRAIKTTKSGRICRNTGDVGMSMNRISNSRYTNTIFCIQYANILWPQAPTLCPNSRVIAPRRFGARSRHVHDPIRILKTCLRHEPGLPFDRVCLERSTNGQFQAQRDVRPDGASARQSFRSLEATGWID